MPLPVPLPIGWPPSDATKRSTLLPRQDAGWACRIEHCKALKQLGKLELRVLHRLEYGDEVDGLECPRQCGRDFHG